MSYATPDQPAPGQPRTRPATVRTATWLLLIVAAVYLLNFVIAIATAGTTIDVYREVYAGTELEGTETFAGATVIGVGVVNLLFAGGFVVLALLDRRGSYPARVVTWVLGGLALCCNGVSLVAASSGALVGGMATEQGGVDPAELQRMLEEALPDWLTPLSVAGTAISVLALLAALILLALPASNDFFRRQPPQPPQPVEPPPPYPQLDS
jgi:predicted anti-sigma-YlaC factor YlaD